MAQPVRWQLAHCIPHYVIPKPLRDFLLDPGSTTQRMQHEYGEQTKVKSLKQAWHYPHYLEAQQLQIPLRQQTLIREAYLSCQNKIWMYARVIFPQRLFTGKTRRLQHELDQRPLGKLIFRDPTMQRSEYEIALIHPNHLEYRWAIQNTCVPDDQLHSRGGAGGESSINCDQQLIESRRRQGPETTKARTGTIPSLWARRSIIKLQTKPLLLTEIFLPGFFELIKAKP